MKKGNVSASVVRYLATFQEVGEILTVNEIADKTGVSPWAVYRALKLLIGKGYVKEVDSKRTGKRGRPIKAYTLTEKGLRMRRAIVGDIDINELIVMLKPSLRFLEEKNLVRAIAVLERFLNDSRKSVVERKIALCLWIFYLLAFSPEVVIMPDISVIKDNLIVNIILVKDIPTMVKVKAFLGLMWVVLPYITTVRRLVMVPNDVLFSDDDVLSFIYMRWKDVQKFIEEIYKKKQGDPPASND